MLSGLHQGCPVSGQRRHPHGAGDGGGGAAGAGAAGRGHRQGDDRVPLAAAHSLPPAHAHHPVCLLHCNVQRNNLPY